MSSFAGAQHDVVSFPAVMRMNAVIQCTGLSRATIYRLMDLDQFPRSFKIGTTASGWLETEVREWINERASSRLTATRSDRQVAA